MINIVAETFEKDVITELSNLHFIFGGTRIIFRAVELLQMTENTQGRTESATYKLDLLRRIQPITTDNQWPSGRPNLDTKN